MTILSEAARRLRGLVSTRTWALTLLASLGLLLPTLSFAQEANIELRFDRAGYTYLGLSLAFGVLAIVVALWLRATLMAKSPGSEKMQEVGLAIREGALAYLRKQVATMAIFVGILAILLFFLYRSQFGAMVGVWIALAFVAGVLASYLAGYAGMLMAVAANMRTAHAALSSYKSSLEIAFRSGAVAGLFTVGMGLIGATLIILLGGADAMKILVGFGFGGSLAALFMRVGGGIFTKAADVGADLVGKVEAGIPEDDPRNPATIADNVGDNVGDCAGMAADVFESYEVTLVAAIILGAATAVIFDQETWMRLVLFALMARGLGIVASIIGILMVKGTDDIDADPLKRIRSGFYSSALVASLLTLGLAWYMMGGPGSPTTPIRTNQLVSQEQLQVEQGERIIAARAALARERGVPTWQVEVSDLVGLPSLQDLEYNPAPMMDAAEAREQQLQQMLAQADFRPETQEVPSLAGYSLLTANSNNPVLDYATLAPTPTDPTAAPQQPTFISVREALSRISDYKVYQFKATITPPAAEGAPPAEATSVNFVHGPLTEARANELVQQGTQNKLEIVNSYPVSVYANAEGKLALALEGDVPNRTLVSSEQSRFLSVVFPATPEQLQEAVSGAQAGIQRPTPVPKQVPLAFVSHQLVPWHLFFWAILFGIGMAFAIEWLTDYYVSTHKKPTQEVAGVATAGPAPMIIQGFAYAAESSVFMVFAIVIALLFPLFLFHPGTYGTLILSFYGIALVGLGLLTTTGYVLAMDTFGPISDNAQGVYEMSGEGHDNEYGSKAVQRLDAAGNTTKALTKGFAIATAVVAAVALFHTYLETAKLGELGLRLDVPEIFLGLLIGGAAPFLFSAFSINAVGRASFQLINEVRRQFAADPGIMAGTSKPNYGRCVAIVTAAAQKELLGPGILAIALPVAVAFGFSIGKDTTTIAGHEYNLVGAQALGGFLAGAILTGQLMAVLLANSGGMWDNAKKIIEDGLYGGKGTEAHKAAVVCDTVGDPFKDTAGPALNPLIKVMNLVALLLAGVVILPINDKWLIVITSVALLALAFSIYFSKKGSLSSSLQQAAAAGEAGAEHAFSAPDALEHNPHTAVGTRRRITVEDATGEDEEPPA